MRVSVAPDLDALYPDLRPARVTATTDNGMYMGEAEALGSRQLPIDDKQLSEKFLEMADPLLGRRREETLLDRLWNIDTCEDVTPLVDALALYAAQ